jgi:WD40 repeat protein
MYTGGEPRFSSGAYPLTATPHELATLAGHRSEVFAVAFSPTPSASGTLLASASRDRTVRLWAVPTGEPLATLEGHRGPVHDVAFAPDGTRLASASGDTTVKLWQMPSEGSHNEAFATLQPGYGGAVHAVAFSPDGRLLASGANTWSYGAVKLWSVADGREVVTFPAGHGELAFAVTFSPDGRLLVVALAMGLVRLWRLPSASGNLPPDPSAYEAAMLRGHGEAVRGLAFSPDGALLATASSDATVRLWRLTPGHAQAMPDAGWLPLTTLKGHAGAVRGVAFAPGGATLASASSDGTVRLWSIPDGAELAVLTGHGSAVHGVSFSPTPSASGTLLASASADQTVRFWGVA